VNSKRSSGQQKGVTFSLYSMTSSSSDSSLNHTERLNQLRKKYSAEPPEDASLKSSKTTVTIGAMTAQEQLEMEERIRGNLTPLELKQLAEIKDKLSALEMPETPLTAFDIYTKESGGSAGWETLTESEKAHYELLSS